MLPALSHNNIIQAKYSIQKLFNRKLYIYVYTYNIDILYAIFSRKAITFTNLVVLVRHLPQYCLIQRKQITQLVDFDFPLLKLLILDRCPADSTTTKMIFFYDLSIIRFVFTNHNSHYWLPVVCTYESTDAPIHAPVQLYTHTHTEPDTWVYIRESHIAHLWNIR